MLLVDSFLYLFICTKHTDHHRIMTFWCCCCYWCCSFCVLCVMMLLFWSWRIIFYFWHAIAIDLFLFLWCKVESKHRLAQQQWNKINNIINIINKNSKKKKQLNKISYTKKIDTKKNTLLTDKMIDRKSTLLFKAYTQNVWNECMHVADKITTKTHSIHSVWRSTWN